MILELNGTKVTIADKTLGYQGDNLVNTIQVTVDKDSTWNYKLDMYKGKSKCFDSVLMTREGNVCTVQLTNEILSYGGRYIFQLRGYTDTQTYHSDIFESWVNASIEYQGDCKQACECDCKLPTEFYQVEDNVTEINNHPPYPGDNGKWMIWDVDKHEYVESDIEVIGGDDYQTKANLTTSITQASTDEQYPSAKATYNYGQSIKSLGITSAAVGDIVKVKAVDTNGKPTEWEASELGETWELLYQTTLTEAVAQVSYSFLDAPCKKVGAIIETPAVEADTNYSYFECETNVSTPGGHTTFSYSPKAIPRKEKYHEVFWGEVVKIGEDTYANVTCIHGNEFTFPWDGTNNANPGHDTTMCGVFKKTIDIYGNPLGDKIISVRMRTHATFPVGTNITFFGVRA